jgi:hypothetical protein
MLCLATASTVLRVINATTSALDVHASYLDISGTTVTAGATNTLITTAATTTVVAAPGSGVRNVKLVMICNQHASIATQVTIQVYDGTTAYQLYSEMLEPRQRLLIQEGVISVVGESSPSQPAVTSSFARPWHGRLVGCAGDGDPGALMYECQRAGIVGATPTNISTSVARCSAFILPADLNVQRIRAYAIGASAGFYTVALYRLNDLVKLTPTITVRCMPFTWLSLGQKLNLTLYKDIPYFIACSANATNTTAGLMCMGGTTTTTTGVINTLPGSLPGNMALTKNYLNSFQFQFAVTTGALPQPAATLAAPAAWTGGMPAFWLDGLGGA